MASPANQAGACHLKGSRFRNDVADFYCRRRGTSSALLRTRSPFRSCWAHRGHSHIPLLLRCSQPAAIASDKLPKSEPQSNQAVRCSPWCAALSQAISTASRTPILIVLKPMKASPAGQMCATPDPGMVRTANWWWGRRFEPKLFGVRARPVFSHRRRRCHLPIDRARSPSRCAHVAHSDGDARRRAFPAKAGDSPVSYAAAFPALPSPPENVAKPKQRRMTPKSRVRGFAVHCLSPSCRYQAVFRPSGVERPRPAPKP
jgi:hypothetical protein